MVIAVRGAIHVDEDTPQQIQKAVGELINALLSQNRIRTGDIVSVFFTVTPDITSMNPAQAVRKLREDWASVPMLCSQEPVIDSMLPMCIRVLVQWRCDDNTQPVCPVYLGEARRLRPDIG